MQPGFSRSRRKYTDGEGWCKYTTAAGPQVNGMFLDGASGLAEV